MTPLAAAAFNDAVGVNLHLEYHNTVWDNDYSRWSSVLINSPIIHLRFGFCNYGTAEPWCTGSYAARFNQLAAAGKKMDILTNPWMGWTTGTSGCNGGAGGCTSGYPANVDLAASAIDAYEGPNECNDGGGNCTIYGTSGVSYPWAPGVLNVWTPEIFTLRSAGVDVYGPAAAFANYAEFPNDSAYITKGALHDYATPNNPENGDTQSGMSSERAVGGAAPIVTTETGYTTGPPYTEYAGESRLAQERYIGRQILFRLNPRINISRVYFYELFDYPTSQCDGVTTALECYGLLDASYNPKPAWTRLMQLMSYFADTGISPKTPLAYTLTGDTTGKLWQDLFQKSNGTYILVPWLGTLQWDWTTSTDISPTVETLTLTLPSSVASVTLTQFGDNGAQTVTTIPCSNGRFSLPVSSLVETVIFHT